MTMELIRIQVGLEERWRLPAAELYYDTFQEKFGARLGRPPAAIERLAALFDPAQMLAATLDGELAGVVGLSSPCCTFIPGSLKIFMQKFGRLNGLAGWLLFFAPDGWRKHDGLHIEGIAVAPELRGRGIGTRLLEGVYALARRQGLPAVSLEVADTNPDARRLYEREGFIAAGRRQFAYLPRPEGYAATCEMVKWV